MAPFIRHSSGRRTVHPTLRSDHLLSATPSPVPGPTPGRIGRVVSAALTVFLWVGLGSPTLRGQPTPADSSDRVNVDRRSAKPNVLFITIDDLNDWVGVLGGHPQSRTPNLDRLARRGVLFTNAHCQAPICNPSRVSFMTGLRPSTSGVYLNNHRFDRAPGLSGAVTLPEHFAENGYETLGCGKLFHGSSGKHRFQTYGPAPGQGPLPDQRFHCPVEQSASRLWDWGAYPSAPDEAHDVIDARWAAARLSEQRPKPFFLGVGFYRPHVPLYAPARWFELHPRPDVLLPSILKTDLDDLPEKALELTHNPLPPRHAWFVESGEWSHAVQAYLACVSFVDDCVGTVLDALDAGPNASNTWIVLLSDHGWHLGEKERWAKQSLWERSTRVPLIIAPPPPENGGARWPRNRTCDRPAELLSLYPTLVDLCGLSTRSGLEGSSLAPLLKNPDASWEPPAITTFRQNNHAVRSRHWRYIRYADGSEELYDHRSDPDEWRNLAGDARHAGVITEHRRWLPKRNAPPVR